MEPSITIYLIIAISLVSVVAFSDQRLFASLLFEPFVMKARGEWHRLLTHAFIHANWPHLVVNMFVLYMFGHNVELLYGMVSDRPVWSTYLLLFLGGVVFSSMPGFKRHALDPGYRRCVFRAIRPDPHAAHHRGQLSVVAHSAAGLGVRCALPLVFLADG
jgi:membrane associated rhomboid family serine protease